MPGFCQNERMTAAVFFDAGNTLFTERTSRAEVYARVASQQGIRVEVAAVANAMATVHAELPMIVEGFFRYSRGWFRRFIAEVFARLGHVSVGAEVEAGLFAAFTRADTFRVFDDVVPVLQCCRDQGLRLGVVSNWSPALEELLEALDLRRFFDVVISSARVQWEKPDPRIFHCALERLGIAAADALHVGDRRDNDVDGARAAGLRALRVDRSPARGPEGEVLTSLFGLIPILHRAAD